MTDIQKTNMFTYLCAVVVILGAVSSQEQPRPFVLLQVAPDVSKPPAAQDPVNSEDSFGARNNQTKQDTDVRKSEKLENVDAREETPEAVKEAGSYLIYHPSGLLQRVVYSTEDDPRNMAFSAKLRYQNVKPVVEPVYTYDPQTYVFRRI